MIVNVGVMSELISELNVIMNGCQINAPKAVRIRHIHRFQASYNDILFDDWKGEKLSPQKIASISYFRFFPLNRTSWRSEIFT